MLNTIWLKIGIHTFFPDELKKIEHGVHLFIVNLLL